MSTFITNQLRKKKRSKNVIKYEEVSEDLDGDEELKDDGLI